MNLDSPARLDADDLSKFRRDGHVSMRGLLDPEEVRRLEPGLMAAVEKRNELALREWDERTTYERAFIQVMNLWRDDATALRVVRSRRLASMAAALLEVDGVRLYHDQRIMARRAESRLGRDCFAQAAASCVRQSRSPRASDNGVNVDS